MRKLLKSFKTEINPTVEQKIKINKTIGTCRYVYNFYLDHNKTLHDNGEKFMTGKSFSVWLNNEYIPNNPDKIWIKEAYSKAVKKSIEDGYGQNMYEQPLAANGLIVMGNEGNGIGKEVEALINRKLYIPNYPQGQETSESLNVAIATAVICAEFRRQAAWK